MLVKLKLPWFSPTDPYSKDKMRNFSGRLYDKGIHEFPESVREFLPKTNVEFLDEKVTADKAPVSKDIKDYDGERQDADEFTRIAETAEETRLANARKRVKRDN